MLNDELFYSMETPERGFLQCIPPQTKQQEAAQRHIFRVVDIFGELDAYLSYLQL